MVNYRGYKIEIINEGFIIYFTNTNGEEDHIFFFNFSALQDFIENVLDKDKYNQWR